MGPGLVPNTLGCALKQSACIPKNIAPSFNILIYIFIYFFRNFICIRQLSLECAGETAFVAVGTKPAAAGEAFIGDVESRPGAVQVWSVSAPPGRTGQASCGLEFALMHNAGTVWDLKWRPTCPRGQAGSSGVMGLLAMAAADGCVHVLSVPVPSDVPLDRLSDGAQASIRC